jgi:Glycosyltransferase family 17
MKIWDCFMFRDELDMLECRLVQFQDFPVYRHVLVEAAVDHQGHPKPLVFAENKERFAPWLDRIVHVVADELPGMTAAAPLDREGAQRDVTWRGLPDANPDDWVIIADIDEIPNSTAIRAVQNQQTGILVMTCCAFAVDWVLGPLRTSVICPVRSVTSFMQTRRSGWDRQRIPGAGHHLTWLGGQEAITAKTRSHCHTDCNADIAAANVNDSLYRQGVHPFTRLAEFSHLTALTPVDVDETWPRYVYDRDHQPHCPDGWFRPRE